MADHAKRVMLDMDLLYPGQGQHPASMR